MNCDRARDLIGACRDGELPSDEQREVEAHLATCRSCGDLLADDERIGRALRLKGRMPVPAGLAARIETSLRSVDESPVPIATVVEAPPTSFTRWSPRTIAGQVAAMAAACLLSIGLTWWALSGNGQLDRIERDVLNAHVRSLLQDSPVQVASSDQHTVRPWFAGRVDFSPVVHDLKAEGFPLLGGRLDYIGERRVGALVYKRNLHVINVFMWPSASGIDRAPAVTTRNGYNLAGWTRQGVTYWAISDLNANELSELQKAM